MRRPNALMWGAVLTLALAGRFVFETALVNRLPAAVAVAGAVVPAAAALVLASLGIRRGLAMPSRDRLLAAASGILGFWLAPLLVAIVRKTDAPPGTHVLIFTTAAWGLLLVLGGLFSRKERPSATQVVGAMLGVIGAAAVLANWERPSSFSPFVRFPAEEATMLAAGALWVLSARILAPLVRRNGAVRTAAAAMWPAAVAAAAGALVLAPQALPRLADPEVWGFLTPAAVTAGVLALAWAEALRVRPPHVMAASFLLPASVLSGLSIVEQATGAFGPVPLLWNAVLWGTAVAAAGAVLVATPAPAEGGAPRHSQLGLGALGLAALSVATALTALVQPDVAVSVAGTLTSGEAFSTKFMMLGYETVGGWLAVLAAALVLAEAWRVRLVRTRPAVWAACLCVALVAWVPLHTTHLHSWNSWIPFEVQQDYGTEYASRTAVPLSNPFEQGALLGAAVSAALLGYDRLRSSRARVEEVRPADQEVSQAR